MSSEDFQHASNEAPSARTTSSCRIKPCQALAHRELGELGQSQRSARRLQLLARRLAHAPPRVHAAEAAPGGRALYLAGELHQPRQRHLRM